MLPHFSLRPLFVLADENRLQDCGLSVKGATNQVNGPLIHLEVMVEVVAYGKGNSTQRRG